VHAVLQALLYIVARRGNLRLAGRGLLELGNADDLGLVPVVLRRGVLVLVQVDRVVVRGRVHPHHNCLCEDAPRGFLASRDKHRASG
jgi:hypothetical protein